MCAGRSSILKNYIYALQRVNFLNGIENIAIITAEERPGGHTWDF
jgi:hypothetical protein